MQMQPLCRKALLTLALAGSLAGCGISPGAESASASSGELTILTIGTADNGGTMYQAGSAIAQVITQEDNSIKLNVSASTGSNMNVELLTSGEIDLALVSGDVAYAALKGLDEFSAQPAEELRAVAAIYSGVSNWIAPAASPYVYVHDLVGSRLGVGPEGSATELAARVGGEAAQLNDENTTFINCALGDTNLILQGQVDALHAFTGMPVMSYTALAGELPCRVLLYTPEELDAILADNPIYYPTQIDAGTYPGQEEAVDTFGTKCLLCVSSEMPEERVYQLTQALWNAADRMGEFHPSLAVMAQEGFMCRDLAIPLHPGAEQFYQEAGAL